MRYDKNCRTHLIRRFDSIEPLECVDYHNPVLNTEGPSIAYRDSEIENDVWSVKPDYEDGWHRAIEEGLVEQGEPWCLVDEGGLPISEIHGVPVKPESAEPLVQQSETQLSLFGGTL